MRPPSAWAVAHQVIWLKVDANQDPFWRERYRQQRLASIERDLPRGAPPATVDVVRLVELTTRSTPEAATLFAALNILDGQIIAQCQVRHRHIE